MVRTCVELESRLKALEEKVLFFIDGNFSKKPKKKYHTNKNDVYHIHDSRSLENLGLKEYSPETDRGFRYVFVVIDNSGKFGWTVPLKNKTADTKTNSFENIPINSKRKPNLIETDRGKEVFCKIFQKFLNKNKYNIYSRNTPLGVVFAERFSHIIRVLLTKPFFERGDGNWFNFFIHYKYKILY